MELCLVGYTYRGYPMAHALARAAAFGYQGVEIRGFSDIDLSTPEGVAAALDRAAPLAAQHGLRVCSLCYDRLPVSRERERAAEEEAFIRVLGILGDHGVPVLTTYLSLQRPDGRGQTVSAGANEADYAAVRQTLGRVATAAARYGVTVTPETHMGTIHDTAMSHLRIIVECGSPAVAANLDPANMLITYHDERLPEAVRSFAGRIGYAHLKNVKVRPGGYDWNLPLRWGDINYERVLLAFKEAGYTGPFGVEYCGTGDPDVFVADDARYLRELAERVGL